MGFFYKLLLSIFSTSEAVFVTTNFFLNSDALGNP